MQVKHKHQIITAIFIAALSVLFIGEVQALEYQSTVDVQFTFNPYISLAVSGDLVINDLAPGNSADSNIITITASSNSPAGYALYSSVGSSTYDYTDLRLSSTNATNVFTNLSSNKASLSNFSDNTWGYSYSTDSGSTWQTGDADATNAPISGYSGLPLYSDSDYTYTDPESGNTINTGVKLVNAEKNTATEVQFKIGAKASATQVTGTYTNVVNFINVAKIVTTNYTINYNANVGTTGDAVTNMPTTPQTGTTTSGAVTLPTNVPTRDGYSFKGWCDVDNSSDQSTCSDGTNTGTITQPGGVYALNTTNNSATVDMYAVWERPVVTFAQAYAAAGKSQTSGYYVMQDMTSSICSSVTDGQSDTLRDARGDGINYTVAKIDSLCWMTANLALGKSTTMTLTPDDTNISSNYTLPARGTYGTSYSGQYVWGNDTQCTSSSTTACAGYYSYAATTAGTNPSSGAAVSDICPKGWRLPTIAELTALSNTYTTGATLTASPFLGVYAGYYYNSSFRYGGSYGYYWSSTADNSFAYRLHFDSSSTDVDSAYKYIGYSIRCVAKE